MKTVALYVRRSADHRVPNVETQLRALTTYAGIRGWQVAGTYQDQAAGCGLTDRRPALRSLILNSNRKDFSTVLVFSFALLARSGKHLNHLIEILHSRKIGLCSVTDGIDSGTPFGEVAFIVAKAFPALEGEIKSERCRRGIERARRRGKKLGRPIKMFSKRKARQMLSEGSTLTHVGTALGVSRMTIKRKLGLPSQTGTGQERVNG